MNIDLLIENLTNPALLFFMLGIVAVFLKSDLEIPNNSSKFISIYLLFSIGFKGGQELSHSHIDQEIVYGLLFGVFLAILIPFYSFFILKKRLGVYNAGAIAAAYGSVSAVTFVTAVSFLEIEKLAFNGHMVAVMALMEAPAIVVGVALIRLFSNDSTGKLRSVLKHALTNGSVLLILGSLVIGFLASDKQGEGIKPFTTDIFKGFLAVFLLDMGIKSGKNLKAMGQYGLFPLAFGIFVPLINGIITSIASGIFSNSEGDRLLFAVLASSASYIAVPAAMKMAAPKANPGLYIPMALAITFPFNIILGIPFYLYLIQTF